MVDPALSETKGFACGIQVHISKKNEVQITPVFTIEGWHGGIIKSRDRFEALPGDNSGDSQ